MNNYIKCAFLALALPMLGDSARADPIKVVVSAASTVPAKEQHLKGICIEDVNHEIYGGLYSQMIFGESFQEPGVEHKKSLDSPPTKLSMQISERWQPIVQGNITCSFKLSANQPFVGRQSQQISFETGNGEVGISNAGLNHWGMNLCAGKPYEGCAWIKSDRDVTLYAQLQSVDGSKIYAEKMLPASSGAWHRVDFTLSPNANDPQGRFALVLKQPAEITIGYVSLQPGEWGRFAGLPVRRDIVQSIIDTGVSVMRYGGSMVNSPGYRWKNMVGPRDRRPPYNGTWYPYSSNGWGVLDFLNLCEATKIVAVPDLNVNESPQDLADFIEYTNGSVDSTWGKKRAADGHPLPYRLHYLELGNEEKVDKAYADKFAAIARAIWAHDSSIILIAGDFSYKKVITDPDHLSGADSGITNLDGQRQILKLADQCNREVWFDIHIWSEQLNPSDDLRAAPSYIDALQKISNGARHQVVTFELNANTHSLNRALANAMTINTLINDGRMPIITTANGLQPDGQNDNGWDQGLVFFNPAKVWLQPAAYVTQMQSRNDLPVTLKCNVDSPNAADLNVIASLSNDQKALVVQIVNLAESKTIQLDLGSFKPTEPDAQVTELTGPLPATNSAENPTRIAPTPTQWPLPRNAQLLQRTLPAHSFTIIRFK